MAAILGIDIGGTKCAVALGDPDGSLGARRRRPTEHSGDPRRDLGRLADEARELCAEAGGRPEALAAIGVSVPGPLDPSRSRVQGAPNLPGWDDVALREILEKELGAPVAIENDADAAALAEWGRGAGQGARTLVYLTMSTGVGAGLVVDGRLHRGAGWGAGEIGHAAIEWDGEPCACGLRGCLEAYVGGNAWAKRLCATTPDTSRVLALAGRREAITAAHAVAAAHEGDAFALAELAHWNGYLARALVWLAMVLAPEVIVLGTIASAAGERLCLEPLRRELAARVWPAVADSTRIAPAALGDALPFHAGLAVAIEALARARRSRG